MEFIKRYVYSLIALVIALIVLFWLLNVIGTRAPGAAGALGEKVGALASGQAYSFS